MILMYWVATFYHFLTIPNPQKEVQEHKDFFSGKDVKGRIYIDDQGINAQFSAPSSLVEEYVAWIEEKHKSQPIDLKYDPAEEHAFYKLKIKSRPLVAFGCRVDLQKRGKHLSPEEWKEKLEKDKKKIIIDARNDYESKVGHFDGAILPSCKTFREFRKLADELMEKIDEETEVMMYCTGGIRCEYLSSYFREKGVDKVYQLEGGIVRYGQVEGSKHWKGKLFVFDDRLVAPVEKEENEIISRCTLCNTPSDTYYNCANMDCNDLFLSCRECIEKMEGCCCETCKQHPRKRSFELTDRPKPFRKLPKSCHSSV